LELWHFALINLCILQPSAFSITFREKARKAHPLTGR
jgi:hypothetical protein